MIDKIKYMNMYVYISIHVQPYVLCISYFKWHKNNFDRVQFQKSDTQEYYSLQ